MTFPRQFSGVVRLYGESGLTVLSSAHIGVVGIGGVGSWVVEALARSGVRKFTLIDADHLVESNINRQIHALNNTLGEAKVLAMGERIGQINAQSVVRAVEDFLSPETIETLLHEQYDGILDCTDDCAAKVALAVFCRARCIPLIMAGSAGGRSQPLMLKEADLSQVSHDRLLAKVRYQLRKSHGFSSAISGKSFGISCVYSDEPQIRPEVVCAGQDASQPDLSGLQCDGYGSSVCVTASMGLVMANCMMQHLMQSCA